VSFGLNQVNVEFWGDTQAKLAPVGGSNVCRLPGTGPDLNIRRDDRSVKFNTFSFDPASKEKSRKAGGMRLAASALNPWRNRNSWHWQVAHLESSATVLLPHIPVAFSSTLWQDHCHLSRSVVTSHLGGYIVHLLGFGCDTSTADASHNQILIFLRFPHQGNH